MEAFVSQHTKQLARNHELEARLGTFTHQGFVPGVHKSTFYKLKSRMNISTIWDKTTSEKTRDVVTGNYRNHHHENGLVTCTKKDKIASKDFDNVRISICEEKQCEPVSVKPTSFIRHKERWSYFKGIWRYDLTHVTTANKDVYEIEIELNDTIKALAYSPEYLTKSFVDKVMQII
tara:strand:+ start:7291 stop:7818 length:528 start_codon:yes stop_codon:yes gene_type:complete